MPDRPNSTQQAVEELERIEHYPASGHLRATDDGDYVRLSDVLNALQEAVPAERLQLAKDLRSLAVHLGDKKDGVLNRAANALQDPERPVERNSTGGLTTFGLHVRSLRWAIGWIDRRRPKTFTGEKPGPGDFDWMEWAAAHDLLKDADRQSDPREAANALQDVGGGDGQVEELLALAPHEIRCRCGCKTGDTFSWQNHAEHCPRHEVGAMIDAALSQPQAGEEEGQ